MIFAKFLLPGQQGFSTPPEQFPAAGLRRTPDENDTFQAGDLGESLILKHSPNDKKRTKFKFLLRTPDSYSSLSFPQLSFFRHFFLHLFAVASSCLFHKEITGIEV